MEEKSALTMMTLSVNLMNPWWCKLLRACLLLHNPQLWRLRCTGLPICRIVPGVDGVSLPSGGMRPTHDFRTTRERSHYLLLTTALFEILVMKMCLLFLLVGSIHREPLLPSLVMFVALMTMPLDDSLNFLRDCGVKRMVHMSDQERSLGAMITSAMNILSGSSDWAGAVRENSAVGESQSNGKAEAAVQAIEDQIRVMKAALESRLSARIPSNHPIMKWLVEYAAVILNKYAVQPSGRTAYHDLHGKRVSERLVEFGETVLHYVPKKHRHKLDMRWGIGVFLGTTMSTNESFIGLNNGTVIRCRAINRVRPDKTMEPRA